MTLLRRTVLAAALAPLGVAVNGSVRAQTVLRFGSVGGLTDAGVWLAEQQGAFAAAGLAVHAVRMPSAPALITALATGQLDVAGIAVTPGLFSAITQGVQIRVVGDKQSVRPGFAATRLLVRSGIAPGTEAAQVAALKGRPVAVSSKAATVTMALQNYLAGFGMTLADVRVTELAYPSMASALASGAVDAAIVLEPFLSQALRLGVARQLNDLVAATVGHDDRGATSVPLVYSESFVANRSAAQGFMDAYLRGVRRYNDAFAKGIDKDAVIAVIAAHAKVDPAVVRDGFPAGLDPNGRVDTAFLDKCQHWFVDQHYLPAPIDLGTLIDPSFAADTVARLGEYRFG
jgi:NitT/TauT family transport system substrate-binding protein